MTFIEFFRKQFIDEGATTRKMLAQLPGDQFEFKPHAKSMDMRRLAWHIADLPGWVHLTFTSDGIDFSETYDQPQLSTKEDVLQFFEKRYAEGLAVLIPANEARLYDPWTVRDGEKIYSTDPRIEVLRMSLSQQIHHRAQLGVYLRLLNIPIPGSYGPSADEQDIAA